MTTEESVIAELLDRHAAELTCKDEEIARLQQERALIKADAWDAIAKRSAQLTAAKQENERLRAALDKIIHSSPFTQRPQIIDFARAALGRRG